MKYKMKIFLRDIPASVLMIVGYSLLFFMVFNGIFLINKISQEQPNCIYGNYNHRIEFSITNGVVINGYLNNSVEPDRIDLDSIIKKMKIPDGNLSVIYDGYCGDSISHYFVNMVVANNEEFTRKLAKGSYPTYEEILNEKVVVIGKTMQFYTKEVQEKQYLKINGQDYRVTGIFEDVSTGGFDVAIMVYYDSFSENEKVNILKSIDSEDIRVEWLSSKTDISNGYSRLKTAIEEISGLNVNLTNHKQDAGINGAYSEINKILLVLLFIFCLSNSFVISSMWIRRRMTEFSIRKAYGYSIFQIAMIIAKDILKYIIIAIALSGAIQIIYNIIVFQSISIDQNIINDALYIICTSIIVIFLTIIVHLKIVKDVHPAQGTNDV